jgi:hypothetical protein
MPTVVGIAAAALIGLAVSGAWLDGSLVLALGLAALSAGVFGAAYFISSRQIEAAVRDEAIAAKNQISILKAKVTELKQALDAAADERAKHVRELQLKIDTLEEVIRKFVDAHPTAKGVTSMAGPEADLRAAATPDPEQTAKVAAAADAAATADAAVDATATDVVGVANGVLPSVTALAADLPEKHRLAGVWVAAGVAIAVLAFLSVANVNISTSDTSSTGPQADRSDAAEEPPLEPNAVRPRWSHGQQRRPHR